MHGWLRALCFIQWETAFMICDYTCSSDILNYVLRHAPKQFNRLVMSSSLPVKLNMLPSCPAVVLSTVKCDKGVYDINSVNVYICRKLKLEGKDVVTLFWVVCVLWVDYLMANSFSLLPHSSSPLATLRESCSHVEMHVNIIKRKWTVDIRRSCHTSCIRKWPIRLLSMHFV